LKILSFVLFHASIKYLILRQRRGELSLGCTCLCDFKFTKCGSFGFDFCLSQSSVYLGDLLDLTMLCSVSQHEFSFSRIVSLVISGCNMMLNPMVLVSLEVFGLFLQSKFVLASAR
jgi:hypothetical protein